MTIKIIYESFRTRIITPNQIIINQVRRDIGLVDSGLDLEAMLRLFSNLVNPITENIQVRHNDGRREGLRNVIASNLFNLYTSMDYNITENIKRCINNLPYRDYEKKKRYFNLLILPLFALELGNEIRSGIIETLTNVAKTEDLREPQGSEYFFETLINTSKELRSDEEKEVIFDNLINHIEQASPRSSDEVSANYVNPAFWLSELIQNNHFRGEKINEFLEILTSKVLEEENDLGNYIKSGDNLAIELLSKMIYNNENNNIIHASKTIEHIINCDNNRDEQDEPVLEPVIRMVIENGLDIETLKSFSENGNYKMLCQRLYNEPTLQEPVFETDSEEYSDVDINSPKPTTLLNSTEKEEENTAPKRGREDVETTEPENKRVKSEVEKLEERREKKDLEKDKDNEKQ